MADHPLRPATRRCLGEPLPHQQADRPRDPPEAPELSSLCHATVWRYRVLIRVSSGYSRLRGRFLTCYAPVRHSLSDPKVKSVRLACIKHAASVRPEPGSNSPSKSLNAKHSLKSGALPYYSLREFLSKVLRFWRARVGGASSLPDWHKTVRPY